MTGYGTESRHGVAQAIEGNLRQGRMTGHRTILSILTLLAILPAAIPSSAPANPLLSGYGGSGEGSQEILGSALLGGGAGGGGGTGGGPSGPTGSSLTGAPVGQGSTTSTGSRGRERAAGGASHPRGKAGEASAGAAGAYPSSSRSKTSQPAPGSSETLGLSGADLLYILLALGALACTGLFTRRLTQTPPGRNAHSG